MTAFTVLPSESRTSDVERAAALADPGFAKYFSDHMATATWADGGWRNHMVKPLEPFVLHPSAGVLHYAQEIFEGMKAYRHADGSVWLFRPEQNAERFARSAERMSMPALPVADFVESVETLVDLDRDWVPEAGGEQSMYIRPFMIADETFLGVRPSATYTYAVIAAPVGPFYPDPVRLWVTPNYTRAAPGGTGAAKCGGNYAASMAGAGEAARHGCGQVLWLDGAERRWVEECGTMNVMFVTADNELITPELTGTILAGITRDSLLTLAPEHGVRSVERRIGVGEVFERVASGDITEVLACGTAAVITPIIGFKAPEQDDLDVGDATPGPVTNGLRQHLLDIQYGRREDVHGWMRRVGSERPDPA